MKTLIHNLVLFFEKLSSRPKVGGLEITNSGIQYLLIDDGEIIKRAIRLPPGVMRNGELKDRATFLGALKEIHNVIFPKKPKRILPVVVALPAEIIYSESFKIPNLGPERLVESANLNLKSISPLKEEMAYMDSQVVKESEDHYDMLGVFAPKEKVDGLRSALEEANFFPLAFEFPALAITRFIDTEIKDGIRPIFILQISSDGLNFIILKNHAPYFNYFRSWHSVQGDAKEITKETFESVVKEEIRKVINFTFGRFKQDLSDMFVVAPGLEADIKNIIETNFNLKVDLLSSTAYPVNPSWYVVLGSALRGLLDPSRDKFISLNYLKAADAFYEEQILNFIILWRNIFATVFTLILAIFIISAVFLVRFSNNFNEQLKSFRVNSQTAELTNLENSAKEFNRLVGVITKAKIDNLEAPPILNKIKKLADSNQIVFEQIALSGNSNPISVSGRAPDSETVRKFKNVLVADETIMDVNLPLSKIVNTNDNFVTFTLSFRMK